MTRQYYGRTRAIVERKKSIYDKTCALTFVAATVTLHIVVMSRLVDDSRGGTKSPVLRVAGY